MKNSTLSSPGFLLFLAGCGLSGPISTSPPIGVPYIIIEGSSGDTLSLDLLAARLATRDVVFFGEVHDDPTTHQLQLRLLEAIAADQNDVIVGMEMFGRPAQSEIDSYLAGELAEADFLERSRPWSNYALDYRPVLELARHRGWPVVGTNLPQEIATRVAREGIEALERLSAEERGLAASANECPRDLYWSRFQNEITGEDGSDHAAVVSDDPALGRMFEAQCARDEAMAESIASALRNGALLYHLNGSFHSDFQQGIVPRLLRRLPTLGISTISAIPPEDDETYSALEDPAVADFIILINPRP